MCTLYEGLGKAITRKIFINQDIMIKWADLFEKLEPLDHRLQANLQLFGNEFLSVPKLFIASHKHNSKGLADVFPRQGANDLRAVVRKRDIVSRYRLEFWQEPLKLCNGTVVSHLCDHLRFNE